MIEYAKAFTSLVLKRKRVSNQPIYVNIDTSAVCNLKCKMCFHNESFYEPPDDNRKFLSADVVEKMYTQIKPKILILGGLSGEPLMNKNICEFVRIATKNKSKCITTTNGLLLNEDISYQLIDNGIHMIKISVDAATKDTYKKIRQSDHFDKLISNIRRLVAIAEERGKPRGLVRLEFVIQNDNLDEIIPFLYMARNIGIHFVNFMAVNFIAVSNESEKKFKEHYNLEKIINTLKKAHKVAKKIGVNENILDLLKDVGKMGEIKDYKIKDTDYYFPWYEHSRKQNFLCLDPWLQMGINWNGDVSVCCVAFHPKIYEKGLIFGNIFNGDNLSDIWNGKKLQNFRKTVACRDNFKKYELCRTCIYKRSIWSELKKNKFLPI